MSNVHDLRSVSPALAAYAETVVFGDLWKRADLSPRDRGLVTIAALVARNLDSQIPEYVNRALDDGVTPSEISETVTHLAFYCGWTNAMAAVSAISPVFQDRRVGTIDLPPAVGDRLPVDAAFETSRAANVEAQLGATAPALVKYLTDVLFLDLWLRPALAPRDKSLVTVSALITSGHAAQIPFHLNRAMDNGLTAVQAAEVIAHLAFYAGWPNAMSAAAILKDVLVKRGG